MNQLISIRVWGDYACFTRPEMKVERVSYPIMTPSAARGTLEAIFWEPQIYYLIDSIRVVRKGHWFSFRRNEVISVIGGAQTWMKDPSKVSYIEAGGGAKDGTQRNMLALQDVEYLITAEVRLSELGKSQGLAKYLIEIERRARGGKCFHRPCLGVREFAANFEWVEDPQAALERGNPDWEGHNDELGLMLYDMFDPNDRASGFKWLNDAELKSIKITAAKKSKIKNLARFSREPLKPMAKFFHATVEHSTMACHPERIRWAG